MGSFIERRKVHDKFLEEVEKRIGSHRYSVGSRGLEKFPPDLRNKLRSRKDTTSLFIRFEPDLTIVGEDRGIFGATALIEVKSKLEKWENHSFELEPYKLLRQWSEKQNINIFYIFPDFHYCRVIDFLPEAIYIPKNRYPDPKIKTEIEEKFPYTTVIHKDIGGRGSHTIFGVISPPYFRDWPKL